jgi:hypothetical protein
MNYSQRKDVIEKLEILEKKFPVENWKLYGIHVWPLLKVRFFFDEYQKLNNKQSLIQKGFFLQKMNNLRQRMISFPDSIAEIAKFKSRKAEFLFSGAYSHRVWHKGEFINRYFDPIIHYLETKNISSLGVEYSSLKNNSIPYIKGDKIIHLFRIHKVGNDPLLSDQDFIRFLEEVEKLFGAKKQAVISVLAHTVISILQWKRFYLYVFKKIRPKFSFGLCYYSIPMWGMNAAAKELGISSIDMQHGTQGKFHAAYCFGKIPEEGYNILPKEFWCWDKESYEQILSWTKGTFHQTKFSGNPWFEFLLLDSHKSREIFPKDKPIILYTHQPLKPLMDDYFIETIKKTKETYHWWIRLHPNMNKKERTQLLEIFQENDIMNFVNIDKATELPLPVLLKECTLHISKFSGSIIEAAILGTPSIILEEIGICSFQNIINKGKAIGIKEPTADLLVKGIREASTIKISSLDEEINFQIVIDKMLEEKRLSPF